MASENFRPVLNALLVHEGGFVNHPRDPGGATNKGVTQQVYDDYRDDTKQPRQSVRHIREDEVEAIFRNGYWKKVQGDKLPAGLDYAMVDFAYNSGHSRANRYLQMIVGAAADGILGPATLALVAKHHAVYLIDELCDRRQAFLENLDTFDTFGKGWTRRVKEVRAKAKEMTRA